MKNNINKKQKSDLSLDFLGIGAPKSATSWLYFCLQEHPNICTPEEKEISFFNEKIPFVQENTPNYEKGLGWYLSHFDDCPQDEVVGEFSVNYFGDEKAPVRIHSHFPNIKLILILRNPVDRAYSHYHYKKAKQRGFGFSKKAQEQDFLTFLEKAPNFKTVGYYDEHLKRWLSVFDKEQLLIWVYEDIQSKPDTVVAETYDFLSVDSTFTPPSLKEHVNTTKEKQRLSFGNPFLSTITEAGYWLYDTIFAEPDAGRYPPLPQDTREELTKEYLPHIKNTEEMLERDLSRWYQILE